MVSCSAWASRSAATKRRIGGIVGDDQHFGGTCGQVDGGARGIRGDDLLGGRHPGTAGAENLVDLANAVGAECERGDGLRAAHLVDRVDAAQLRGHQYRGVQLAVGTR